MALRDPFHELLESGRPMMQGNQSNSNSNNNSSSNKLKLHPGINILKTNTKVIYAGIFDKQAKESKSRIFLYIPGLMQIQSEESIDTREKFFNIPPKDYTTNNDQHITIDLYVKYQIVSAVTSYQSSQSVTNSIMEDIKSLVDSYVGQHDDNFFDTKRKITINDLEQICQNNSGQNELRRLETKYGIKLVEITSNNIFNAVKHQINETAKREAARRIQTEENRKLQLQLEQREADTRYNIEKQRLELKQQELQILNDAINKSGNADALARMYSNNDNQNVDVYHHNSRKK